MAQEITRGFKVSRPIASQSGAVLDCSLLDGTKIGGGTPTDNTAVLNGLLASAGQESPVFLLLDGPTACNGILIASAGHTTIEGLGWDCGIWINSASNRQPISNHVGGPFEGGAQATTQGQNLTLRNFRISGNRGNGTDGNSNSGDPRGKSGVMFYSSIDLANLDHVRLENLFVDDSALYAVRTTNCNDMVVSGCRIHSANVTNCDGIHIDGPASDIFISSCYIATPGDDAIALNAPEGISGSITRVVIANCVFNVCLTAVRAYGFLNTKTFTVSEISITNCVGHVHTAAFFLGEINAGTKPADVIASWSASHCQFTTDNYIVKIADSVGVLVQDDITWQSPSNALPWVHFECRCVVSDLQINNCKIYRTPAGHASAYAVQLSNHASISKLTFSGFSINDQSGQSYGQIPYLIDIPTGGSIGSLVINSIDTYNIAALVNPTTIGFAGISSISGPGVLATGFQIPDAVMADGVPYVSATAPNTGIPCIKIHGTVQAYAPSGHGPIQQ